MITYAYPVANIWVFGVSLGELSAASFPKPEASFQKKLQYHVQIPQYESDAPAGTLQPRTQPTTLVITWGKFPTMCMN